MANQLEYTLARPGDAVRIATMSRDLIENGLEWRWRSARVLKHILSPETNALVVRAGDTLAGFAIMQYHSEDAHLLLLAANPSFRRRGVGRGMVEWLEKTAQIAGIARIQLEVRARNHPARVFYQTLGYREARELPNYYYGREAAVRMLHDLRVSV